MSGKPEQLDQYKQLILQQSTRIKELESRDQKHFDLVSEMVKIFGVFMPIVKGINPKKDIGLMEFVMIAKQMYPMFKDTSKNGAAYKMSVSLEKCDGLMVELYERGLTASTNNETQAQINEQG